MKVIEIDSLADARVQPYTTLRARKGILQGGEPLRAEGGVFVAESEKVVRALLESELEVVSVFAEERYLAALGSLLGDIDVLVAKKEVLDQVVGMRLHQGIMALGRRPEPPKLEEMEGVVVALDGLANAENVGAIVRSCAAFGVSAVLVDGTSADPYLRRAVRVSMAGIFYLGITYIDLEEGLAVLKDRGFRIIGTGVGDRCVGVETMERGGNVVVVIGSEGRGVKQEIRDLCDQVVTIPISEKVESLNAAAAATVLLYEMRAPR